MCRGYRNGNRSLRCLCRHSKETPMGRRVEVQEKEARKARPGDLMGMISLEQILRNRGLPDTVSYG